MSILKTLIAFLFRLFPLPTEPGLRIFGNPGENSPVFVTSNFDLTVKRVSKYLKNLDCYLLIAPSKGINVWCASTGGFLNAHSIISVVKTSRIGEKVKHRRLILPQLSAPGIDTELIKKETGWHSKFGPVYAEDIPRYVKNKFKKTKEMNLVKFSFSARLEMAIMWAFSISAIVAIPFAVFWPTSLLKVLSLIWGISLIMFLFYSYVPGKIGIQKALFLALIFIGGFIFYSFLKGNLNINRIILWSLGSIVLLFIIGFDFEGSTPLYAGSTTTFWSKKWPWVKKAWAKLGFKMEEFFAVNVDSEKCTGCRTCIEVCPLGVHEIDEESKKSKIVSLEKCVQCTACVRQCPEGAIWTEPPIKNLSKKFNL
ncbi:MAG: HgcAB-like fusion protein [Candidatus Aminicenantia bacterium]